MTLEVEDLPLAIFAKPHLERHHASRRRVVEFHPHLVLIHLHIVQPAAQPVAVGLWGMPGFQHGHTPAELAGGDAAQFIQVASGVAVLECQVMGALPVFLADILNECRGGGGRALGFVGRFQDRPACPTQQEAEHG